MAETPFDLVIRFTTSEPDITIHVDSPTLTSALRLKQLIRADLSEPASCSRLRLIHAGKAIEDKAALVQAVRYIPPPPTTSQDAQNDLQGKSLKALGKQPVRDPQPKPVARVYVHCSVGDVLSASELAAEASAAQEADAALLSKTQAMLQDTGFSSARQNESTTISPAPRGFERLLSAGFTAAEVATLRTQFLAIQAHSHTPDTMPSGAELLALEEQWLDNTSSAAGGEGQGGFGAEDAGVLEDMLYGNIIGFFWPMGAMFWLMREEGVWSRRKQISVLSGFLVNLTFGFLRILN